MAAEMEDAVRFLERVSTQYYAITSLLSNSQLLALDMNPKEPFQNDDVRSTLCSIILMLYCN